MQDAFNKVQLSRREHFETVGFHRPTIAAGVEGDRFIVRGNEIMRWRGKGSFLNFLANDLFLHLGASFSEIKGHPINVWWRAVREQAEARRNLGGNLFSTAAVLNFFTVAYDLFLLSDNTNLRERLVKSLRVPEQFHGARYELMIAACLARGGYSVEFADENKNSVRHCDAVAVHRKTKHTYYVEMKAKGRPGIMGKLGDMPTTEQMKGDMSRLLRDALSKPAAGERLIFIDVNLPSDPQKTQGEGVWWQKNAVASVRAVETQPSNLLSDVKAYVIFTNSPSHHGPLDIVYEGLETAFTGFNMPNFAEGLPTLGEAFPQIADLFDAFMAHSIVPEEFPDA